MPKAKKKSFGSRMSTVLTTVKSPTINPGFSNVNLWADLGNYSSNRIMSGRFDRGFLFGRNYVLYGESGSGKSLQAAVLAANCQRKHNAYIIWIDAEVANDGEEGKQWFRNAGLSLDEDSFYYTKAATLEDIKSLISKVAESTRKDIIAGEETLPTVIVVDSWSGSMTGSQMEKAEEGKITSDMGQKAKQTGEVIQSATHLLTNLPVLLVGIAHVMDSQEMYGPKYKTTGGQKMIFYASGCMIMTKKELTAEDLEDKEAAEEYQKQKEGYTAELKKKYKKKNIGITSVVQNLKSRVSKPFEKTEVQITYEGGIDQFSGLFDLMIVQGIITKAGVGWYQYIDGKTEIKFQRSSFRDHADRIMEVADIVEVKDEEESKEVL